MLQRDERRSAIVGKVQTQRIGPTLPRVVWDQQCTRPQLGREKTWNLIGFVDHWVHWPLGEGGVQGHREVQVQDVWIVFTRMLCALGTMCRYNEPVLARYSFSREPLD